MSENNWQPITMSDEDVWFNQQARAMREAIVEMFGIPPQLLYNTDTRIVEGSVGITSPPLRGHHQPATAATHSIDTRKRATPMTELSRADLILIMRALSGTTGDLIRKIEQVLEEYPDETVFYLDSKQSRYEAQQT